MSIWLSASELADLALPDCPATRDGWNKLIERERWFDVKDKARVRAGRGGGYEFHIDLWPVSARVAYLGRTVGDVRTTPDAEVLAASAPGADKLSAVEAEARDARMALVASAERLAKARRLSQKVGDRIFAEFYNRGEIEVPNWIARAIKSVSPFSLGRWRREIAFGSTNNLGVDRGAAGRGKGALDTAQGGAVRAYILALIAHQPHLSADHVRTLVAAKFEGFEAPPIRTFQHYLKALKTREAALLAKITNPDAFKSRIRISGTNSHAVERLNELWMIDASPADALCVDGRHALYVCIDIFSRRVIVHVSRTPRAEAVALLMRRAILAWGVPERVKTDNGSDFTAKATQRLFAGLQIETETAAPFSPEQKGHVERAIGTMQRDLMPLLPGFVGHSVADRKVIEERKAFSARLGESDAAAFCVELKADELQRYATQWAEGRYAQRPHAGLGGATPFATAAAFTGRVRRIENIRALDLLLTPIAGSDGLRTVTKTGLRIDHSIYIFAGAMVGTKVFVRMDASDMGRAYVFEADGETFLGEAVCPELAGIDPAEAVAKARAQQKRMLEEQSKALRADMRKIRPRDMVDAVVRDAAERAGKLVAFPRAHEGYSTPALDAANEALAPAEISAPTHAGPKVSEPTPVVRLPETKQQRFKRARALEADMKAGVQVAADEALWLGGYQQSAEYRAQKMIAEEFGEAAIK